MNELVHQATIAGVTLADVTATSRDQPPGIQILQ